MEATSPLLLFIGHDPGLRGVLCAVLRRAGYRVEDAPSGSAGLARIQAGGVALVLLEHDLVDMESLELCRRLHQDDRHAALPVLLLTGWQDHLQRQAAVAAGVDDFVRKPPKTAELLDRVAVWLRLQLRLQTATDRPRQEQERLEQVTAELGHRMLDVLAVKDCITAVTSARPLPAIIDRLTQVLVLLVEAQTAVVFPCDTASHTLDAALGHGIFVETPPLAALRTSLLTSAILGSRRPQEFTDLDAPAVRGRTNQAARALGWRGLVAQPLVVHGQCVGLLYVAWDQPHELDERERQLIHLLAQHLAVSLALEGWKSDALPLSGSVAADAGPAAERQAS